MTKRMLIDASHAEETRVVVLDGNRLEEFDLEAATRKPLKGNIYLAKVVRVEPSLQAAFVEYGGNRHGFLAFSEIHPDYYQIPVADRQRLLQMQAEEAREAEEAEDDPIPESPMDRAAEEELTARARAAAEATVAFDPEAAEPDAEEAGGGTTARSGDAAEAGRDGAAATRESEPPPGIASAAAAESEVGAAAPESGSPVTVEEAMLPRTPPADAETTAAATAEAGQSGLPQAEDDPPLLATATPAPEAGAPGAEAAPAGPPGGAADAAAGDGADAGFDAAPAEALEAGSLAEGEAGPEEDPTADAAAAADAEMEETAPARRTQGEPRQARRRDGRGRGRRDDRSRGDDARTARGDDAHAEDEAEEDEAPPETLGGEGPEEGDNGREERRIPPRFLRHYKIQEVIKRRQIMLVQVVKEERGTKGAALTTYISLAGRFSVLMPNSPRGGGVSRKITSAADRKRLREAIDELSLPDGMSLIVRTAGAQRPKPEIKRDCEYLLRLWDNIRERTLASTAPALIYEEADLIKRAIRDVFSRDVEEIIVEGEDAYQEARDFMRMLMPQHVKKIQYAREGGLFARAQVEQQLDAMHSPTVQLKSGGYVVINQTEALVAIDVNSGRATRERHIEDTALRTNLEAADEIARQLRLRDLAGLIVIDFIDMESSKHDGMVERRLKEALRFDRARIQVGRISHFGLLEMSRQRLRPSLAETSFVTCPHCQGRGTVRSIESSALSVLRAIEEEGAKRRAAEIAVHCCSSVALYLLNRKRDRLTQLEEHFGMAVLFEPDESLAGPQHRIERLRAAEPSHARALPPAHQAALRMDYAPEPEPEEEDEPEEVEVAAEEAAEEGERAAPPAADAEAEAEAGRRRRRRRRRRGAPRPDGSPGAERAAGEEQGEESDEEGEEEEAEADAEATGPALAAAPGSNEAGPYAAEEGEPGAVPAEAGESRGPRRRRRRGPRPEGQPPEGEAPRAPPPAPRSPPPRPQPAPRYMGPTPADPFAGHVDDILAAMEAAEAAAEAAAVSRRGRVAVAPAPEATPVAASAAPAADPAPDALLAGSSAGAPQPVAEAAAPPAEEVAAPVTDAPPVPPPAVEVAPVPPAVPDAAPAEEAPLAAVPNGAAEPEAPRQGPPVQPKVLGEVPLEAPRRGGWWRR